MLLRLSLLTLAALFAAAPSLAQNAKPARSQEALKDGRWALQFGVVSGLTLSSFGGNTISGKVHLRDRLALRFGLTGLVSANDSDSETTGLRTIIGGNPDPFEDLEESDQSQQSTQVQLGLEIPLVAYVGRSDARLQTFAGIGPTLGFDRSDNSHQTVRTEDRTGAGQVILYDSDLDRTSTTWRGGVAGLLGAEWFATRSISFSAEYGLLVAYARTTVEERHTITQVPFFGSGEVTTKNDTDDFSETAWTWATRPVRFGVTLYL